MRHAVYGKGKVIVLPHLEPVTYENRGRVHKTEE
jgi:hypothetical protein